MRVCQITYSGFGGLGSVVFSLIEADIVDSNEWAIGFIGDLPLDYTYPPRCERNGVEFLSFRSVSGKPYRAWLELAGWLGKTKPDVVICHSINSIFACRWYAWRHRATLITVEHTSNQVKSRMGWLFSRLCMLMADRVVVLTDEYRKELRQAHGWLYRAAKVRLIPNGVDTAQFHPSTSSAAKHGSTIKLGMAARFSFSKRQDLLVDVMVALANLRPDLSFELHFAGNGEEVQRVQALAGNSPDAAHIYFDGLLNEAQMAEWLRDLDVYVHATDGETLSTSLLQAMSTGLPIVASDVPGVNNLLGADTEYGLCVANDALSFAHAILKVAEGTGFSSVLATRARGRVLENYSHQVMLQRYLDVIAECKK
jgi:Glycosyltransferase